MEFLPGFTWPVPRAFASAVSAGRFEQGDVFYDAAAAHEEWHGVPKPKRKAGLPFRFRIQVLDPPRSARTVPTDTEGNRFAANWASLVTCEVSDYAKSDRNEVRSTQGRLFTCLWRGDLGVLREATEGEADLPLPVGARELQKQLDACIPALQRKTGKRVNEGSLFASVVDTASESSLSKARDTLSALRTHYSVAVAELSPGQAGVPDAANFHPALVVRGVWVGAPSPEPIRELLKSALYGPTRGSGDGPDRFKLERHGLLVSPKLSDPPPQPSGDSHAES